MYKVNKTVIKDEQGILHNTYGVSCDEKEIFDISTDKLKIEKLVDLFNKNDLSPVHLDDVIEDYLVDFNL